MTRSNLPFAFLLLVFILAFFQGAGHRTKDVVQKLLADKDIHELGGSLTPHSQQSQAPIREQEQKPGAPAPEQEGFEFKHALAEVSDTSSRGKAVDGSLPRTKTRAQAPYAYATPLVRGPVVKPGKLGPQVINVMHTHAHDRGHGRGHAHIHNQSLPRPFGRAHVHDLGFPDTFGHARIHDHGLPDTFGQGIHDRGFPDTFGHARIHDHGLPETFGQGIHDRGFPDTFGGLHDTFGQGHGHGRTRVTEWGQGHNHGRTHVTEWKSEW